MFTFVEKKYHQAQNTPVSASHRRTQVRAPSKGTPPQPTATQQRETCLMFVRVVETSCDVVVRR
eukprot:m.441437 g.441437  ORF g.441437 m.441437 type:complete len:64 (-) comp20282_c2_seq15:151-342(-)